jgi:RNA polymerase sigma-70 factor (ECF subfamily)
LADHDVEDVVQGIFIALLRKLPQFELDRSRGRFRTWLWQVAHHAVVDWVRARRRMQKAENQRRKAHSESVEDSDGDWDTMHRQRIAQFVMDKVCGQTIPQTWACFEEHLLKGRPGAEVGTGLGLPANTVYVNAARVLARIREQVAAYRKELGDD